MSIVQAAATGAIVGAVFALLGYPVPAPATLTGVAGVVGITAGGLMIGWLRP